jgi:ferredoxin-NADP reductase
MMTLISRVLNGTTMYRLMIYYLGALFVAGLGLAVAGATFMTPSSLLFSLVVTFVSAWGTNRLFGYVLRLPLNAESVHITALILVLIMPPAVPSDPMSILGVVVASVVAIGSKFVLTIGHKHIFNPVAIGAVAAGLLVNQPAVWWVGGSPTLLPLVVIGGLLVTHKVQRLGMIASYLLANLAAVVLTTPPEMLGMGLQQGLIYSPLFFAGFAMLTEPLTAAHGRWSRHIYAILVGALSSPNIHIANFYFSPELAFLVANLYAWAASPKGRFRLELLHVERIAADCYDYVFRSDRRLNFRAGQYLDWTLGVRKPDNRGNRRTFTIASSPSEDHVRLGVKFYSAPSAFKQHLLNMSPGDAIYGSQIAGTFTLPRDPKHKILLVAGGIGITPFRSMIQDLLDRGEQRDIILLYGNRQAEDIAYMPLLARAERELGLRVIHAVSQAEARLDNLHPGRIDAQLMAREVPDIAERYIYVSGPTSMVSTFRKALRSCGASLRRIHTDLFPGFG